jgi:hypothetical protein
MRKDILLGSQTMACQCESQHGSSLLESYSCAWLSILYIELDIIFVGADRHPMELATTSLRITVSANVGSSMDAAASTPNNIGTTVDSGNHIAEGDAARPVVQTNNETMQPAAVTPPLSPLPYSSNSIVVGSVADNQTEMSDTLNNAEIALDTMRTWSSAVEKVKCVIDAVSPIAEVCFKKYYPVLS